MYFFFSRSCSDTQELSNGLHKYAELEEKIDGISRNDKTEMLQSSLRSLLLVRRIFQVMLGRNGATAQEK